MDRQTLRDWAHRYNEGGLGGLSDRPRRTGPRPRLSPEQQAQVAAWVEEGSDLARDGVVRWRCVDLQARILHEFAVTLHERTGNTGKTPGAVACQAGWPRQRTSSGSGGTTAAPTPPNRLPR